MPDKREVIGANPIIPTIHPFSLMDKISDYESEDWEFESLKGYHIWASDGIGIHVSLRN